MADPNHSRGLQWQVALTNGFIHDGWVESITHPNGFRDVTISIKSPWYWELKDMPLPQGLTHDQVQSLRLIFRFKDVAEFSVSLEGDWWETHDHGQTWETFDAGGTRAQMTHEPAPHDSEDSGDGFARQYRSQLISPRVMRQTIYLWSEVDQEVERMRAAQDSHGGAFHSARMRLTSPCSLIAVFRDCECVPSDWAVYDAWSTYPFDHGIELPPLRATPLSTAGRFVWDNRRHLCTTRIVWGSAISADDAQYLCDECLDEWLEDYAELGEIPRVDSGSGELSNYYGTKRVWERGRYQNQKCYCDVQRPVR